MSRCEILEIVEPCPINAPCVEGMVDGELRAYCRPNEPHISGDNSWRCQRQGQDCLNGGTCNSTTGACHCPHDWTGYACQQSTFGLTQDASCSLACENGGTCYTNSSSQDFCLCTPDFVGDLCQNNRVDIMCAGDHMNITFRPIEFLEYGQDWNFTGVIYIGNDSDPNCFLQEQENGLYFGHFEMFDECGGWVINTTEGSTKYTKNMNIQYNPNFYFEILTFNVSCVLSLDGLQQSRGEIDPSADSGRDTDIGKPVEEAYAPARLTVLNSQRRPLSGSVALGDRVYLVNYLEETSQFKSIYVESCDAEDPDHNRKVNLLTRGCPAPRAEKLFFGDPMRSWSPAPVPGVMYDMQVFKLHSSTKRLSFSCLVKMCRSQDDTNCELERCQVQANSRRRRQAVATSSNPIISIPKDEQLTRVEIYIVDLGTPENDNGIITRVSDPTTQTGFNKETLVVIISVVGSVLLLVCLVLAVVLIHTRRSPRTPQHPPEYTMDPASWFRMPAKARHDQP